MSTASDDSPHVLLANAKQGRLTARTKIQAVQLAVFCVQLPWWMLLLRSVLIVMLDKGMGLHRLKNRKQMFGQDGLPGLTTKEYHYIIVASERRAKTNAPYGTTMSLNYGMSRQRQQDAGGWEL